MPPHPSLDDVCHAVLAHLAQAPARTGAVSVVGVDGPSGAGKSTLADALARRLGCSVVRLDDLIPGWDGLAAGPGLLATQVLEPFAAGLDAAYRRYDWLSHEYGETVPVALPAHAAPGGHTSPSYLVVEGCGAGAAEVRPWLSVLVWVDADRELRRARGLARDGAAYAPHWDAWERQEQALYAEQDPRGHADLVVDGTDLEPAG